MILFDSDVRLAERVDLNVLFAGEPEAGAADVALFLHKRSRRRNAPFITISCAHAADTLFEVALRGAERARGGSLLIEDVDELNDAGQETLLKFVQDAEAARAGDSQRGVDVRVMATTTQDLFERVVAGTFLEGLYYRLNTVFIRTHPLREVRDDIPLLVGRMLQDIGIRHHVTPPRIGGAAMRSLQAYDWPGNLCELHDVLESLLISSRRSVIEPDDLVAALSSNKASL